MSIDDEKLETAAALWGHDQVDAAALDRVLAGTLAQVNAGMAGRTWLRWSWLLVRAQLPIVNQQLAAASLLIIMLGTAVALTADRGWPRDAFVAIAPVVAATGSALLFRDGLGELALVMRAGPRLVMLARLVVVFVVDLVAALLASVVVAGRAHETLTVVIGAWLGPMVLLTTVSLLVSVLSRPGAGITVALGLWFLHVLAGLSLVTPTVAAPLQTVWTTSPAVLAVAGLLGAMAVTAGPRRTAGAA
ncbi:hypothetical protein [Micromonospora sp. 067-2]|uniref:hypothetical protein n=1 Tax=Micromonospora sp. 067-2 TaxID=2789270 RepID=UPI00397CA55D